MRISNLKLSATCWAFGLSFCAALFVYAMPYSPLRGMPARTVGRVPRAASALPAMAPSSPSAEKPVPSRKVLETKPIEQVRVGDRVLGTNPDRSQVEEGPEPDPKTWIAFDVEQTKPSGKQFRATFLRPREWVRREVDPGTGAIYLDLPEVGAVGWARVVSMGSCPPIKAGAGRVVTAAFRHQPDGPLVELSVGGETVGCTANHPVWSEDRRAFVEAGKMRTGERVRTRLGQVEAVVAVKPRPPTDWVYNLEVHGEHTYEVGNSGLLVHNEYLDPATIRWSQGSIKSRFSTGESVIQTAIRLRNGQLSVHSIPAIQVWKDTNGVFWALDNRRLAAFRMAGLDSIPVKIVNFRPNFSYGKLDGLAVRIRTGFGSFIFAP